MVELGKLIISHYPSFSIKILITTPPYNTGSTAPYIKSVSASTPSITVHDLPAISLPLSTSSSHHETLAFELLRLNNPNVREALVSITHNPTIRAFVVDLFCTPALSVASELKVPAYLFMTSGAACLAFIFYLPTIHENTTKSLKDLNALLHIPACHQYHPSMCQNQFLIGTTRHAKASWNYRKTSQIRLELSSTRSSL